jgi:hypothetical protein
MSKIQAFIARSFSQQDETKLRPILTFLRSFEALGFFCVDAERAEVESVSNKVRELIDQCEVFIAFFNRRHPIYEPTAESTPEVNLGMPTLWTTAPWVLQESGYALRAKKHLILLRETDTEVPGLQGDLEYIPFDIDHLPPVFEKVTQMITGVIAKKNGVQVVTSVVHGETLGEASAEPAKEAPDKQGNNSPAPAATSAGSEEEADRPLFEAYLLMSAAAENKNWQGAREHFESGRLLIKEGKVTGLSIDAVDWESYYLLEIFKSGDGAALEKLRLLALANADCAAPLRSLAQCYASYDQHATAAEWWRKAAAKESEDNRAECLLEAARELKTANRLDEALALVKVAYSSCKVDSRPSAAKLTYEILRDRGDDIYYAFAFAEVALNEMPQAPMRFDLGLDYHRHGIHELALLHFDMLHRHDDKNAGALHDLALSSISCSLPILGVKRYKEALAAGETLSASNLAYRYLDSGMSCEAEKVLTEAISIEGHVSEIEAAVAAIPERTEEEKKTEVALLEKANGGRKFLAKIGGALDAVAPLVEVAVGTVVAHRPRHRSVRAGLPHTALAYGDDAWNRRSG